jgi:hypothetical protein
MSNSNKPEREPKLAKEYQELLRLRAEVAKLSAEGAAGRRAHDRGKKREKKSR